MTFGEAVTRSRRGPITGVDRYGNPTYGPITSATFTGAAFDPGGSTEPQEIGRDPVSTSPALYFPSAWPDIAPDDLVTARGVVWRVIGRPADWRSPWGSLVGGLVVHLERLEG